MNSPKIISKATAPSTSVFQFSKLPERPESAAKLPKFKQISLSKKSRVGRIRSPKGQFSIHGRSMTSLGLQPEGPVSQKLTPRELGELENPDLQGEIPAEENC